MGSTEIAPSLGRAVIQCSIRKENPRSRHSRVIDVQIAMAQRVLEVIDRAGEQMRERLFVGLDGVRVGQRAGGPNAFRMSGTPKSAFVYFPSVRTAASICLNATSTASS